MELMSDFHWVHRLLLMHLMPALQWVAAGVVHQ